MAQPRASLRRSDVETLSAIESSAEAGDVDLADPSLYFNRELSLLAFQRRVFDQARCEDNPLLERVKFLAIVHSNLDEFFMVRVAGLKKQIRAAVAERSMDGRSPQEQLVAVREEAARILDETTRFWTDELCPALAAEGIVVQRHSELSEAEQAALARFFETAVFPVLTPLAVDPARPFPHISNLSLNLAVTVRDPDGVEHFARVKVPGSLPRLVPLGAAGIGVEPGRHRFVWLEELIEANLHFLFPGMVVEESHIFRLTRDADMVIQELEAADLLETMEESVWQRQFGTVVRLTVNDRLSPLTRSILSENLEIDPQDVYTVSGPLGLSGLMALTKVDRSDLKYPGYVPHVPPLLANLRDQSIFAALRGEDVMLHHPYDSFSPVVEFLRGAANDPHVLAIKQTLYRVGSNAPVVHALLEARRKGKQVAVLVELKARFDEQSNIEWARALEAEGVHVIYGLLGLKTHSKIALVVRQEEGGIRRYCHLSTGNYNAVTANLYTDIGYFTCDEAIGAEVTDLFNYLTGYSLKDDYETLLVAPINLRRRLEGLIQREIEHVRRGERGHVSFVMNSLVDGPMIRQLYRASRAGVDVDLMVRGICCLRPGLAGISERIRVRSIVGRFLEHARIYYFRNAGRNEIFLGSADLMPRNINSRVEVLFPVKRRAIADRLRDQVLAMYWADNVKARELQPDGTYRPVPRAADEPPLDMQQWLMRERQRAYEGAGAG